MVFVRLLFFFAEYYFIGHNFYYPDICYELGAGFVSTVAAPSITVRMKFGRRSKKKTHDVIKFINEIMEMLLLLLSVSLTLFGFYVHIFMIFNENNPGQNVIKFIFIVPL